MKDLDVLGVRVEVPSNTPMVLLRERSGQRYLPIWVGAPEATAIAYAQQGVEPPRPLTHDLALTIVERLGAGVREVVITAMDEGVFYAELILSGHDQLRISCRPSDGIALALRAKAPIRATDAVMDLVGVDMAMDEEDVVEKFRAFLDQVSAEDFEE